jgi:iron complex outermembrane receptor protein
MLSGSRHSAAGVSIAIAVVFSAEASAQQLLPTIVVARPAARTVARAKPPVAAPQFIASAVNAEPAPPTKIVTQTQADKARAVSSFQKLIVSEQEVEKFGDGTVGDVLRRQPGMTFTGPAGVVKDIRLRGLDKGYTQFTINDQPVPTATKERQLQVDRLPADTIENIEIIRNPQAIHESGNVGGIVNVILKKDISNMTRFRAQGGRNGKFNIGEASALISRRFEDFGVLFSGSHFRSAEDIVEDKNTIDAKGALTREYKPKPAKKSETVLAPRLIWDLGGGRLTLEPFLILGAEHKNENSKVRNALGVLTKGTTNQEDKKNDLWRVAGRYDGHAEWFDWFVKAGAQEATLNKNKRATESNPKGIVTKYQTELEKVRERLNYVGVGTERLINYDLLVPQTHKISTGLEFRDADYDAVKRIAENGKSKDALRDRFDIHERRLIAYGQNEWHIGESHWLTPGLRYERVIRNAMDANYATRGNVYDALNPSLHYRWAVLEDLNFRASIARTVRFPKFDDLNPLVTIATGALAGQITNPDQGGNPDLRPEQSLGVDFGFEKFFLDYRGVFGVNFYNRNVQDFIQRQTTLEGARYVQRPQNVGDARFWGMEIDWRAPLLSLISSPLDEEHELFLTGNHSELRGRVSDAAIGRSFGVKDLPPRVTNLGLEWRYLPTLWSVGGALNYVPAFTVESIDGGGGGREIKSRNEQVLLDLFVAKALGPGVDLRIVAKNVLSIRKTEQTIKLTDAGTVVNAIEGKTEFSAPTVYFVFQARF